MSQLSQVLKSHKMTYKSLLEHMFTTHSQMVSDAIRDFEQIKRLAKHTKARANTDMVVSMEQVHISNPWDSDEDIVFKPVEEIVLNPVEDIVLKPVEDIVLKPSQVFKPCRTKKKKVIKTPDTDSD